MSLWRRLMSKPLIAFSVRSRTKKARIIDEFATEQNAKTLLLTGALMKLDWVPAQNNLIEDRLREGREVLAGTNLFPQDVDYPFYVIDPDAPLPFEDKTFDFALANAIIEHVGDEADQRRFIAEHCRVARAWAITTPNRWFPVEAHTTVAFRHWSPRWRGRQEEFTRLLSRREFRALLPPRTRVVGRPWGATFTALWSDSDTADRQRPIEVTAEQPW